MSILTGDARLNYIANMASFSAKWDTIRDLMNTYYQKSCRRKLIKDGFEFYYVYWEYYKIYINRIALIKRRFIRDKKTVSHKCLLKADGRNLHHYDDDFGMYYQLIVETLQDAIRECDDEISIINAEQEYLLSTD